MDLALFDLDNTLIDGDSDYAWGQFLCEIGAVDRDEYQARNQQFYADYLAGQLDIHAYLRFALKPLADNHLEDLLAWRARFISEKIEHIIIPEARELVARHRAQGDLAVILSSTNAFIAEPIGELLGVDEIIATRPGKVAGRYSGGVEGVPCFRDGKVKCLENWLLQRRPAYRRSWFYSDSANDLPMLEWVDRPTVVNGDDVLLEHAAKHNWPTLFFRPANKRSFP